MQSDLLSWLLFFAVSALCITGCAPQTSVESSHANEVLEFPLRVPEVVDLGILATGTKHSELIKVVNTSSTVQQIQSIHSSCSCVTVQPTSTRVEPLQHVYARVTLDFTGKQEFKTQQFLLEVVGTDASNTPILKFDIRAAVVPEAELHTIIDEAAGEQDLQALASPT